MKQMNQVTTCNSAAFDFFLAQLPELGTTEGLVRAAVAVSMHALDDVRYESVERQISALAARVRSRVRGPQLQACLAHLHDVLFEEEQFLGDASSYYSPLNSYLPVVLERRVGIPVTLSLVYKAVAEQLGLRVVGLNTPLHFLVEVRGQGQRMIIDPFQRGKIHTLDEVYCLLYRESPETQALRLPLPVASHQQWISRIIANLQQIFSATGRRLDFAAMTELQQALQQSLRPRR